MIRAKGRVAVAACMKEGEERGGGCKLWQHGDSAVLTGMDRKEVISQCSAYYCKDTGRRSW